MSVPRRAAIFGVTGFVGRGLPALLAERGVATTGISRSGSGRVDGVDGWQKTGDFDLAGHPIVINLAGEPVDRRWTRTAKREFYASRVGLTERIVAAIRRLPEKQRPAVWINASAIGIYGDRGDEPLVESAAPGEGYLADLCVAWERAALPAEELGVRVVRLRVGVVLGHGGAAYEKLKTVFRLGIGGRLGAGTQWMPWIHLDDLRGAILHAIESESLSGAVNGSAPVPERNRDFTRQFARALHRPALLPVPAFALRLALGEFSSALLASARVLPERLEQDGFAFRFPTLEGALEDLAG